MKIPETGLKEKPEPEVTIPDVLLSMQRGFVEDVKPTWEKWDFPTDGGG